MIGFNVMRAFNDTLESMRSLLSAVTDRVTWPTNMRRESLFKSV